MNTEPVVEAADEPTDEEVPVCVSCFTPINPGANSCSSCGSTVGQFTEYVPFVNIPWQADGYDRLRRESWTSRSGVFGQIVQIFVTLFLAPILLIGLPFKWAAQRRKAKNQ